MALSAEELELHPTDTVMSRGLMWTWAGLLAFMFLSWIGTWDSAFLKALLLVVGLTGAAFYFLFVFPERKRQKAQERNRAVIRPRGPEDDPRWNRQW